MSAASRPRCSAAQRLVYRLHRLGIAWGTFGSGALCGRYPMPVMKKSQYRWQMTQPVPATTPFLGCNPTGTLLGAVGDAPRAPRRGREFWLPAVEKTQLLFALNPLKTMHKYTLRGPAMNRARFRNAARSLVAALVLAACCGPVRAGDAPPGEVPGEAASEAARTLVDEVLRKAGGDRSGDDLGEWTRSTIERALERAAGRGRDLPRSAPGRTPRGPDGGRSRRTAEQRGHHRLHQPLRPGPELETVDVRGSGADRRAAGAARRRRRAACARP